MTINLKDSSIESNQLNRYDVIVKNILLQKPETNRLEHKNLPLIAVGRDVAKILHSPINKIGPHAEVTNKIANLEKLKTTDLGNQSFNLYCTTLIKECISTLKEKRKG